jgi:magnesium transporter
LLDRHVVVALFIPVVLGLAESVSIQSITIALQRLHAETLTPRSVFAALGRELATGLALGLSCGLLVGLFAWGWKGPIALGLALFGSIGLAMAAAAMIALGLPLLLHAMRRDPRVAAGPIALVAADLITLSLYYLTAQAVLN